MLHEASSIPAVLDVGDVVESTSGYVGKTSTNHPTGEDKIWTLDELCGPGGFGFKLVKITE
jgi:hypothetical protein